MLVVTTPFSIGSGEDRKELTHGDEIRDRAVINEVEESHPRHVVRVEFRDEDTPAPSAPVAEADAGKGSASDAVSARSTKS